MGFFSHSGEKVEVLGNYVCSTALFHHHFLKVQQTVYLKEAKAILGNETCIILMDFSENYCSINTCPRCNTKFLLAESTSYTSSLCCVPQ